MKRSDPGIIPKDTKKVFRELGTCSRTFFFLLNREFGSSKEIEEGAADPLAGGIMTKGQQCGMLWGAVLAVGAEAFRKCDARGQAIGLAIAAAQQIVESFIKKTGTVNCREITNTDFSNKFQMIKYLLFNARSCFNLAEKWAPEAIQSASIGLSCELIDLPEHPVSCASEVVRRIGASDDEMVMVAGFAGGLGLSGSGCGALSAAIWMNTLVWRRKQKKLGKKNYKVAENKGFQKYAYPDIKTIFKAFYKETGSKMVCHEICGKSFKTIDDHSEFIKNGGCDKLIDILSRS